MSKKIDLQAKATELEIDFEESTTVPQLEELIAEKTGEANTGGVELKGKAFFYVLYVDCYIDDNTILPRGVYRTKKKIERLDTQRDIHCAKFEGKIPQSVLHKLAEALKITLLDSEGDYREDKEILEEIVQEL